MRWVWTISGVLRPSMSSMARPELESQRPPAPSAISEHSRERCGKASTIAAMISAAAGRPNGLPIAAPIAPPAVVRESSTPPMATAGEAKLIRPQSASKERGGRSGEPGAAGVEPRAGREGGRAGDDGERGHVRAEAEGFEQG